MERVPRKAVNWCVRAEGKLKGVTQQKGKKDDFINTIIWSYCTSCDGVQSTAIAAINGPRECRCDFLCIILAHCLYWIFDITLEFEQEDIKAKKCDCAVVYTRLVYIRLYFAHDNNSDGK